MKAQWKLNHLQAALRRIKMGEISFRAASKQYGVPFSTLRDKYHGRSSVYDARPGPKTYLTRGEENKLVEWAKGMARIGFGQNKDGIQNAVKKFLDKEGRKTPFIGNRPGEKWWRGFKRRHKDLVFRRPQVIGKERAVVSNARIIKWFDEFKQYIKDQNAESILSEPRRIFNTDESGFALGGRQRDRVLAGRGEKRIAEFKNSDKTQVTVLAAVSADGEYLPPMIVLPGRQHVDRDYQGAPKGTLFARTQNGWIDAGSFFSYVANVFHPYVLQKRIPRPVLLLVDGLAAHQTLQVASFCRENDIILYRFPPHATHILQPCDLTVFRSLKTEWYKAERAYRFENPGDYVTKSTFARVFKKAWSEVTRKPHVAKNGFKVAGLYPFTTQYNTDMVRPATIFSFPRDSEQESSAANSQQPAAPLNQPSIDGPSHERSSLHQTMCDDSQSSSPRPPSSPPTFAGPSCPSTSPSPPPTFAGPSCSTSPSPPPTFAGPSCPSTSPSPPPTFAGPSCPCTSPSPPPTFAGPSCPCTSPSPPPTFAGPSFPSTSPSPPPTFAGPSAGCCPRTHSPVQPAPRPTNEDFVSPTLDQFIQFPVIEVSGDRKRRLILPEPISWDGTIEQLRAKQQKKEDDEERKRKNKEEQMRRRLEREQEREERRRLAEERRKERLKKLEQDRLKREERIKKIEEKKRVKEEKRQAEEKRKREQEIERKKKEEENKRIEEPVMKRKKKRKNKLNKRQAEQRSVQQEDGKKKQDKESVMKRKEKRKNKLKKRQAEQRSVQQEDGKKKNDKESIMKRKKKRKSKLKKRQAEQRAVQQENSKKGREEMRPENQQTLQKIEKTSENRNEKEIIKEKKKVTGGKVKTKTRHTNEYEYICPECLSPGERNQRWIGCDVCFRWIHSSCTRLHLLNDEDISNIYYQCRFCASEP